MNLNENRRFCPLRLRHGLAASVVAGLCLATVVGCDSGRPKRVLISGEVLIDGKPLTRGFIRFEPQGGRPATGAIGPDGRFTLRTYESGDGAVMGTHRVSVTAVETLGDFARRWHAPKKYADPATSGLTVVVDGLTDSLPINLTWEGKGPYVERDARPGSL